MKWYEQKYVNHRDWILDQMGLLGMESAELVVVLLIDFMNQNHIEITMDALKEKTGIQEEELNRVISALCAKKYLDIKASARAVVFDLSGLFETDVARVENILDRSLIDTFETEFGRTLSQNEMQKISDWNENKIHFEPVGNPVEMKQALTPEIKAQCEALGKAMAEKLLGK